MLSSSETAVYKKGKCGADRLSVSRFWHTHTSNKQYPTPAQYEIGIDYTQTHTNTSDKRCVLPDVLKFTRFRNKDCETLSLKICTSLLRMTSQS